MKLSTAIDLAIDALMARQRQHIEEKIGTSEVKALAVRSNTEAIARLATLKIALQEETE